MKPALWVSVAVVLSGVIVGDLRGEWPRINPKVTAKQITIRKVVILPAHVIYRRVGLQGVIGGTDESERIAAGMYSAVSRQLTSRGVEVLPNPQEAAKTEAERYAIADLQTRYDAVNMQIRSNLKDVDRGRITLDDRVARFTPGASADALVFLRGGGESARLIVGGGFHTDVAFVDSRTGEVLAFVYFEIPWDIGRKPEDRLARSFDVALHDLPLPLPRK